VSHVTIRVRDFKKSISFYQAFGFECVGEELQGQQFLRCKEFKGDWTTHILLVADPNMATRSSCASAGMTRLCMLSTNINADLKGLADKGLKPMGPVTKAAAETLAAFTDPDGFVVYIIQLSGFMGKMVGIQMWYHRQPRMVPFHWTLNVTDLKHGKQVFEKLGFVKAFEGKSDEVHYDVIPSFNIPEVGTVLEGYRMCKQPKDTLFTTILEWTTPRSAIDECSLSNTMTISVNDVEAALEMAGQAGMTTEAAKYSELPLYGKVLIGAAVVEAGNGRVEFCCFTNTI
jgi:catechol 2,3-dioxygenase-like lactoylglutathione lyase family enzyme